MANAPQKITLSPSRDIPFDKLSLSQSNVRRIKCGVSIGALADDIARRTLLQSLNVRPILNDAGEETGRFEVSAGGRRFRALELLVKQKRLAKSAAIPCVVRTAHGSVCAEEDSFAENTHREQLHPLDQFRAMQLLVDAGQDIEAIAAHFMTTPAVVRQRLKLASVSPVLHEIYAEDGMTLEQLMAFSISEDHVRQEQVWEGLQHSYNKSASYIRNKLTESGVRVTDKRVRFVSVDAYVAAGGGIMRDLFEHDDGGWLTDAGLLDQLVAEKLGAEAERIGAEGWKWVSSAVDLPWRVSEGMRALEGKEVPLTEDESARLAALRAEADALEAEWADNPEVPAHVVARVDAIDAEIGALVERPQVFEPEDIARAGAFVSIDFDGSLVVERGYVRAEDEPPAETSPDESLEDGRDEFGASADHVGPTSTAQDPPQDDEEGALKPLSDRLVAELTAWRTLALQDALAQAPTCAFAAVLHAMVLGIFYPATRDACLQLSLHSAAFSVAPDDLRDSAPARAIESRHTAWRERLPDDAKDLWTALQQLGESDQAALFAHCASLALNAQHEIVPKYDNGRLSAYFIERRLAASHVIARAVGLDVAKAGWRPTANGYFGGVTKARIVADVTEARGPDFAAMIANLKKGDMAREAAKLLEDTTWLPAPLRTPALDGHNEVSDVVPGEGPSDDAGDEADNDDCEFAVAAE